MATEERLINANALLERLNDSSESWAKNLQAIRNWCPHAVGIKDNISRLIREAPTVNAVEVVHGYWIDSYSVDHIGRIIEHSIDCSVCDSVFKDESREVVKHWKERFEMCPFCGAKMDGVADG